MLAHHELLTAPVADVAFGFWKTTFAGGGVPSDPVFGTLQVTFTSGPCLEPRQSGDPQSSESHCVRRPTVNVVAVPGVHACCGAGRKPSSCCCEGCSDARQASAASAGVRGGPSLTILASRITLVAVGLCTGVFGKKSRCDQAGN